LDPPPPDPKWPAELLPDAARPADTEDDEVRPRLRPTDSPITAISSAAATTLLLPVDSSRRTLGQRACSAILIEADRSGEDVDGLGGEAPTPSEPSVTGGPGVALEAGRAGRVSWGFVGSKSLIRLLFPLAAIPTVPIVPVKALYAACERAKNDPTLRRGSSVLI
jgi:hypothetical protein